MMQIDRQNHMLNILRRAPSKRHCAYAYAILLQHPKGIDWSAINREIIDIWSKSALEEIKRWAWAIAESAEISEALLPQCGDVLPLEGA